ncbi:mitochondrial import receptor subunit TOM22 homolog [Hyalella azteca]|uniref:Mitochondrial import receptor subunit TOM22 homolog n=1 Tax=Hyalella azteca TaxID=294128 RepID=A0A8B7NUP5_HYAAZ|nr:mitochondrial import receptor subunit TOM22 homolog [Hyalella azteca]
MANEVVPETDSGVASSDGTPVAQESVVIVPSGSSMDSLNSDTTKSVSSTTTTTSNVGTSKLKPSVSSANNTNLQAIEEDDDDIDESLFERLVGLTEMFPDSVRNVSCCLASNSLKLITNGYSLSRQLVWFTATTSLLLFAPVLFEVERLNAEEMIKQDRNKLVLGPGTAMSGSPQPGLVPPAH